MAGNKPHSPAAILAMLRHLPEGCVYTATITAQRELELKELRRRKADGEDVEIPESGELPDLERLIQEKRTWTLLPSLMAEQLNRDRVLIWAQFDEKNRPDLDVFGPESQWPESQKRKYQKSEETRDDGKRPLSPLERHFGKRAENG
jgi:hypothetical protein